MIIKATVDQFDHPALAGRFGWLFDIIDTRHMVGAVMVGGIKAAFPIDIDPCIGFKPEIFYVQMRIDLQCILRRDLWDHFGNFRKAWLAPCH